MAAAMLSAFAMRYRQREGLKKEERVRKRRGDLCEKHSLPDSM